MQSHRGYFFYRITIENGNRRIADVPYIRWGQAWMMCGLSAVLEKSMVHAAGGTGVGSRARQGETLPFRKKESAKDYE